MRTIEKKAEALFDTFRSYTITYIAVTNWHIDYIDFSEKVTVTDASEASFGDIVQVKYEDKNTKQILVRGIESKKDKGCFSNSASVMMSVPCVCKFKGFDDCGAKDCDAKKYASIKVPSSGKMQVTGCQIEEQVALCLHSLFDILVRDYGRERFIRRNEVPVIVFCTEMLNFSSNVGFNIIRSRLYDVLKRRDIPMHAVPCDKNYAGVTVKMEVEGLSSVDMTRHRYINGKWYTSMCSWTEYLRLLRPKNRIDDDKKTRYHTFLVFYSGNFIQSGPRRELMKRAFVEFYKHLSSNRKEIED